MVGQVLWFSTAFAGSTPSLLKHCPRGYASCMPSGLPVVSAHHQWGICYLNAVAPIAVCDISDVTLAHH